MDRPSVELKRVKAVGYWTFAAGLETTCAICRNQLAELCVDCSIDSDATLESCSLMTGACNHQYHVHCIRRFLTSHSQCPLDGVEWTTAQTGR